MRFGHKADFASQRAQERCAILRGQIAMPIQQLRDRLGTFSTRKRTDSFCQGGEGRTPEQGIERFDGLKE
ncbi:hypothetical protein [Trinickia soli]|uniref:hypothetical protein n=1 Tax=Trinickia soli TaxID=380675 RepID=UPI0011AED219|nr:hypothetical protein [Trinickia soli]